MDYDFSKIKAIIGLGNPGKKYYNTRHNIGFRIADSFVQRYNESWKDTELLLYAQVSIFDEKNLTQRAIHIVKPTTFMNLSGKAIPFLLKKGIKPEEILVIHDELEKPFGKCNIRWDGSARGHNGLRSIDSIIGKDYWRLRFGIGRPEDKSEVGDYVLSPFTTDQEDLLGGLIEDVIALISI